jgi:hypothetical protein
MATPMVTNMKKLSVSSFDSNKIDRTLYTYLIGPLMYMFNTRLDIYYAVSTLSHFMSQRRQTHWIVAKHVLRSLQRIKGHDMRYNSSIDLRLQGYIDSNWARSAVDRKSTSRCFFTLVSSMIS